MVSFRGGGDSSGVFNIGSSKTMSAGWRQNCSDTSDISTSSSAPSMNLAEVLGLKSKILQSGPDSGTDLRSLAEPKEVSVRLQDDFSTRPLPLRQRLAQGYGNLSISEVQEQEEEEKEEENEDVEVDEEFESKEDKQNDVAGVEDDAERCPYYLSDDGAYVFSTN